MKKKALITGITGQDGSYLAELLLKKGYEVYGLVRRASTFNRQNIEHIFNSDKKRSLFLLYGDMTDFSSLVSALKRSKPDEIYNLAAQSHVRASFDIPVYTAQSDAIGVLNLLEAVRIQGLKSRIYQASTSELFSGDPKEAPQNENTIFNPKSPYGVAKLYGYQIAKIYRESYKMFICNGILFNHESPRRGNNFITRKITLGISDIVLGRKEKLFVGNLDACRDWGYAPEYMEMAWKMLQVSKPDDFVIATGETHSIREFIEIAFRYINVDIVWTGKGVKEKGINKKNGKVLIEVDPDFFRPNEVSYLCGNPSKASKIIGWRPKVKFKKLIEIMMKSDLSKKQ